jgi:hypothetical protein
VAPPPIVEAPAVPAPPIAPTDAGAPPSYPFNSASDAGNQASQNVTESVTQANDDIQEALQPEPSGVVNAESAQPNQNIAPNFTSESAPAIDGAKEVGRAVLSAVPVVGPAISAGEAIAGQTITGRELSNEERLALGASAALGAIPVAQGARAAVALGESAGLVASAATAAGRVVSSPAFGAQVSGAVTRGFEAGTADSTDPQALDNVEQQAFVAQLTGNVASALSAPLSGTNAQATVSGVGNAIQQNIGDTDPPNNLQDVANFAIGAAIAPLPDAAKAGAGQLAEQLVANADNVGLPLMSEVGSAVEKVVTESARPATELLLNVPTDTVNDATAEGSQVREGINETVNDVDSQVQSDFEHLVNPVPVAP